MSPEVMSFLSSASPFLIIPVGYVWNMVSRNRDDVAALKADLMRIESQQSGIEKSMERFISNLEKSINNQQEVTKEIHILVTTLDKRMAIFESILDRDD